MTVSDADREKVLLRAWREDDAELRVPDSPLGWAIIHVVDAALSEPVPATLDPNPMVALQTNLRHAKDEWCVTNLCVFNPGPEYVQDRAAYEGSGQPEKNGGERAGLVGREGFGVASVTPPSPEREALRERLLPVMYGLRHPGGAATGQDWAWANRWWPAAVRNAEMDADLVLVVFPSRSTVAPTEEQVKAALTVVIPEFYAVVASPAVLALFPGESREAVEAAQRERDAQIAEGWITRGDSRDIEMRQTARDIAHAIREADRG